MEYCIRTYSFLPDKLLSIKSELENIPKVINLKNQNKCFIKNMAQCALILQKMSAYCD